MQILWLMMLPLMFMPNPGIELKTGFGEFELADFLLPIFLLFIFFANKSRNKIFATKLFLPFLAFWVAATVSTLLIPFVYSEAPDPFKLMTFSLLKLIKFSVYTYIGLTVARLLESEKRFTQYHTALLVCGMISGLGLIAGALLIKFFPFLNSQQLYKSANLMSVVMAMLLLYNLVLYLEGFGSPYWRRLCRIAVSLMLVGQLMSDGRGGLLGLFVGMAVYFSYRPLRGRNLVTVVVVSIFLSTLYVVHEPFQKQVKDTFFRDEAYLREYSAGVGGVDDGGRLKTWAKEFPKIIKRPFFGSGFYHRSRATRLAPHGSHNFFLQILLECGIIGALALGYALSKIYAQAKSIRRVDHENYRYLSLAYRIAFVGFIIGALGGEYFYGGLGLFTFFLIYAPLGSIPAKYAKSSA